MVIITYNSYKVINGIMVLNHFIIPVSHDFTQETIPPGCPPSRSVTSQPFSQSALAAPRPPQPAPTTATRGRRASLAATAQRSVRLLGKLGALATGTWGFIQKNVGFNNEKCRLNYGLLFNRLNYLAWYVHI